jgi:hypothetical protein
MKKALLTLFLITLICAVLKAQDRATTQSEYDYLRSGNYAYALPGHTLRPSIQMTVDFLTSNNLTCKIYELYRDGSGAPCAILLNISGGENVYNIAIPDYNSDPAIWKQYQYALTGMADGLHINALVTVAYALGKYAASH